MTMRYRLVILTISLFCLCSCSSVDTSLDQQVTTMLPETSFTETSGADSQAAEIAVATEENIAPWITAYYEAIKNIEYGFTYLELIDIDFDEIPELFLMHTGTGGSWISHGFSFKDGNVSELEALDMPTDLELYQNKENGELLWLASGVFKSGGGAAYHYQWSRIDFSDLTDVKKEYFFEWKEEIYIEGNPDETIYRLLNENGSDIVMEKTEIEQLQAELFSQYEQLDALSLGSLIGRFASGSDNDPRLDQELFISFVRLYEDTTAENLQVDSNDPQSLPIYSIINANTYNGDQLSEYLISFVLKRYTRDDENEAADISISYLQLNRSHNLDNLSGLNSQLKEYAFFDWHVKDETGLELKINQWQSLYEDYLSVRQWSHWEAESAPHPWGAMSAMTFNIKTGEMVELKDILVVDETLKSMMYAGAFKSSLIAHEDCIEWGLYDRLWDMILKSMEQDTDSKKYNFYLTEDKLGFILSVSHVEGDYLTFEIPYEQLGGLYLNAEAQEAIKFRG